MGRTKKFLQLIQEHSGDLSPLEAGVYILRLFSGSERINYYLFIDGFHVRIPLQHLPSQVHLVDFSRWPRESGAVNPNTHF